MNRNSSISSFRVFAAPLCVTGIFLLAEIFFRLTYFGLPSIIHPTEYTPVVLAHSSIIEGDDNPAIGHRLKPDIKGHYQGAEFSTNRYGFRERDVTLEKPPGVVRIAVMGHSITMGAGVNDEEVYTRILQTMLDRAYPGRYEVLNFATGGYTLHQVRVRYEFLAKPFSPDIIMFPVYYDEFVRPGAILPYDLSSKRQGWAELRGNYVEHLFIYRALRKVFKDMTAKNISIDWQKRGRKTGKSSVPGARILEDFLEKRRAENIPVIMLGLPRLKEKYSGKLSDYYNERFRGMPGAYFIDTSAALKGRINPKDYIYFGDTHPNATVHRLYAEAVYDQLVPMLPAIEENLKKPAMVPSARQSRTP
ncbi:MAG: SGNH/GDSL hydrolase family protein [Deltaproteobacteria bacterium]|nr:SGNH/GDSL hydrolase family protein [Deltaproteobacteria bacterium]